MTIVILFCGSSPPALGDDGYGLWLNHRKIADRAILASYTRNISAVLIPAGSPTRQLAGDELRRGLKALLGKDIALHATKAKNNMIVLGTSGTLRKLKLPDRPSVMPPAGREGFSISFVDSNKTLVVAGNEEIGLLYGVFHLLRLLQNGVRLDTLRVASAPAVLYRMLDHWDNVDGTVERGYAGKSLWKWKELPGKIDRRYRDYARACASIGINSVVLNNVNANPVFLTREYLTKAAALADVFRPYGIRIFLSVNFASPLGTKFEQEGTRKGGIGNLPTADPLDREVRSWWNKKANEIFRLIPDFGGFLVKASSEGMPGPNDYGRTHADGANMLAEMLYRYRAVVIWRAFVYDQNIDSDRVKRSYKEFTPLDGKFGRNVFLQVKNGPLDFQPREPVHPLIGAMRKTPTMLELQITQEYLGHSTHLVYLGPMWKEYLDFDTYAGPGSATVASVIEGKTSGNRLTGIAGVANIGSDRNWCGHIFAQANWYAFGRLAWDPGLSARQIAGEWIRMSLTQDSAAISTITTIMMGSWEACVNYMTPLGLHHIMQEGFHYGPGPQHDSGRMDWRSTYYHRADSSGIGYERSSKGSDAVAQYYSPIREMFDNIDACPDKYLLWFHHVPWSYFLHNGRTVWQELCLRYYEGTAYVDRMAEQWSSVKKKIDPAVYAQTRKKLVTQARDAAAWRDTCLSYFRKFSGKEIIIPQSQLQRNIR